LEPRLPELIKELHFMGGSFHPQTQAAEFHHSPRREFNLRFDPEAARIVLRTPWRAVTCSPIDVSQEVKSRPEHFAAIAAGGSALGAYFDRFGQRHRPLWDEVAAATWIDPTLVTDSARYFIDVSVDRGSSYGDTLSWDPGREPGLGEVEATVQKRIDEARFIELFIRLLGQA
jgi:inosine-uridine nucleoside N-ribohydrolase